MVASRRHPIGGRDLRLTPALPPRLLAVPLAVLLVAAMPERGRPAPIVPGLDAGLLTRGTLADAAVVAALGRVSRGGKGSAARALAASFALSIVLGLGFLAVTAVTPALLGDRRRAARRAS